nr:hypothetical protein Iba_chr11cCG0280 [Ipomoea batatas]
MVFLQLNINLLTTEYGHRRRRSASLPSPPPQICLTTIAAAADLPHYRRHRRRSEVVIVRKKEVQLQRGTWLPVSLSDVTPPAAEGSLKLSYNKEEEAAG